MYVSIKDLYDLQQYIIDLENNLDKENLYFTDLQSLRNIHCIIWYYLYDKKGK